jgi:mono/diheme cytochrome c family protein
MVYTGSVDDSAALSWADPSPLESNPATRQIANGKVIYLTNCASCHTLQGNVTGPPLAWITARRDRKWLFEFTRNSARMLWRGDAYSCYLFNRYSKRSMEIFPNLSDSALGDLYAYIAVASRRIDSSLVLDQKRGFDSCAVNDPKCSGATNKTVALSGSGSAAGSGLASGSGSGSGDSASAPIVSSASYYGFSVNRWGWYNVAQRKGVEASDSDAVAVTGGGEAASSGPEPLQACPCWCDETAYRRADSVARAHSAPRTRVSIPR